MPKIEEKTVRIVTTDGGRQFVLIPEADDIFTALIVMRVATTNGQFLKTVDFADFAYEIFVKKLGMEMAEAYLKEN